MPTYCNEILRICQTNRVGPQITQHATFVSGALGPVDGINPELSNLTCSLTFVNPGDIVFLTSDGVSDNFDPVVGKFCAPAKSDAQSKPTSKFKSTSHLYGNPR